MYIYKSKNFHSVIILFMIYESRYFFIFQTIYVSRIKNYVKTKKYGT